MAPSMAPTACPAPGCSKLTQRRRPCPDHAKAHGRADYAARGSRASRGYPTDKAWGETRRCILDRDPICRLCGNEFSDTVDHRRPLERGGKNDDDNLQGLGARCHTIKTNVERTMSDPDQVMLRARKLCLEAYGRRPVGDGG